MKMWFFKNYVSAFNDGSFKKVGEFSSTNYAFIFIILAFILL